MFIGVNTNIRHKGETYHVQTEDGGIDQHTLTTVLFKNGAILSSKKTSYIDLPLSPTFEETAKGMMQEQHKQMMRDLVRGKFDTNTEDKQNQVQHAEEKLLQEKHLPETGLVLEKPARTRASDLSFQEKLNALISDYLEKKEAHQA